MQFTVSEMNRLAVDLGRAPAKVVGRTAKVIAKAAHDVERDAKSFCPVDTGNLRNSISSSVKPLEAEIGPTAEYGAFVEYGTSRNAPQAYMGPALDRNTPDFVRAMNIVVGDIL